MEFYKITTEIEFHITVFYCTHLCLDVFIDTNITVLQLSTEFNTVTCCAGLQVRSNKLHHIAYL